MKCVFCGKYHRRWREGLDIGGICPRCWGRVLAEERKERKKNRSNMNE